MRTKITVLAVLFLVSIAISCALHGLLESSANLIEGLRQFFQPGAGAILFAPFLVLFILLGIGAFAGASLVPIAAMAFLGGTLLRSRTLSLSNSFARAFVLIGVISHFAFFTLERKAPFLLHRPTVHPNAFLVAFMSATIAALNLSVAAFILRKRTSHLALP